MTTGPNEPPPEPVLDPDTGTAAHRPRRWWLAALLSFFMLGLGQIYNGEGRKAVFIIAALLVVAVPGIVLLNTAHFMAGTALLVIGGVAIGIIALIDAVMGARRRSRAYTLRPYNRVAVYVGLALLSLMVRNTLLTAVRIRYVQAFRTPSVAMKPALLVGDYFFVDRRSTARDPARGDLIVFPYPPDRRKAFVKRVVALEGETLEVRDRTLYIDGQPVAEPFVIHEDRDVWPAELGPRDNMPPLVVPPGSLFVMGDNRANSNDSRFWGPLAKSDVLGTVQGIYWSWDGTRNAVRWERLGTRLR